LAGIAVGLALSGAGAAQAANNPGTGDTGFFTFRPSTAVGGTQVNVASGNALVRTRDLADSDGNYHVVVDRAYNSLATDAFSILGPRWAFDVGPATKLAVQSNGDALVTGPSGYKLLFVKQADGTLKAPAGFDGSLVATSSGWTLNRTSQGDQFGFNGSGQLSWTKDSQARDFTVQGTSAAGRDVLSSYGTSSGRRVNLSYTGDSLVREMDDPSSGHHYYGYTNGKLTSYRSPTGAETTYRYASNGFLDKITQPGGTTVELTTTTGGKVQAITTTLPGAVGQTTSFVYTRRPYKTDVTGPDQVRRTYAYDDDYRVTRQYNPDVKPTVTAVSDPDADVTNGTYPLSVQVLSNEQDGAGISTVSIQDESGSVVGQHDVQCDATPYDRVCPTSSVDVVSLNLGALAEGSHALRAVTVDDEGNIGTSDPWTVKVDKTAPLPSGNFSVDLGQDDRSLDVIWGNEDDPDLADGTPGSGNHHWEFRWRQRGTETWSSWVTTYGNESTIPAANLTATYEVEVVTTDAAGNRSAMAIDAVTYTDFDGWSAGLPDLDPRDSVITSDIRPEDYDTGPAQRAVDPPVRIPVPERPLEACAGKNNSGGSEFSMQTSKAPTVAWGFRIDRKIALAMEAKDPNLRLRWKSSVFVNGSDKSEGGPDYQGPDALPPTYFLHSHLRTYKRGKRSTEWPLKSGDTLNIKLLARGQNKLKVNVEVDQWCQVVPNRG
jgi:YD repeat-containing protein